MKRALLKSGFSLFLISVLKHIGTINIVRLRAVLLLMSTLTLSHLALASNNGQEIDFSHLYENTLQIRLKNGFTFVLKSDKDAAVTAVHLRVRTGSIHEEGYFGYGLSHFFEHSLFLGSKGRPKKDQFSAEIESYGGANVNAYTTFDHTAYHFTVLAQHTEKALECMEDLVFHPLFPKGDVENEMGSILSEMDMRNDMLDSCFQEFLNQFAFKTLPYRYPVIGYKERFKKLSREELLAYYYKRYIPSNMILSVVGNFDLQKTAAKIENLFGPHEVRSLKEYQFPAEKDFSPEIGETTHAKAKFARASYLWKTVSYRSEDMAPLDVLSAILAGGKGTILHDLLKEKLQLIEGASASSWTPEVDGLFEVSFAYPVFKNKTDLLKRINEVELAMDQELAKIANGELEAYRVESVKREVLSSFIEGRETATGLARSLAGSIMTTGGINYDSIYLASVQKVTPQDVCAVAKKYLLKSARKKALLVPPQIFKEGKLYPTSVTEADFTEAPVKFVTEFKKETWSNVIGLPIDYETLNQHLHKGHSEVTSGSAVEKIVLSNGLTVLYRRVNKLPLVNVIWTSRGGLAYESGDLKNGSFSLLSRVFTTGNDKYSKADLVKKLKENAIQWSPFSGKNSFGIRVQTLKDRSPTASELLAALITTKSFSSTDFDLEKKSTLFSIAAKSENAWAISSEYFRKLFFKGSALSQQEEGSEETVRSIQVSDLIKVKQTFMTPESSVLSIYGDLSKDELEKQYLSWLRLLPKGQGHSLLKWNWETLSIKSTQEAFTNILPGSKQTYFRMAYRAPELGSPEEPVFKVLSGYLSGMGGPLFKLRSQPFTNEAAQVVGGRAYQLGGMYDASPNYGALIFYAGLREEAKKESGWAISSFKKEVSKILEKPIEAQELNRAKSSVLGSEVTAAERLESVAFEEAIRELYGLGYQAYLEKRSAIEKVTSEQVKTLASKYLNDHNYLVHILGSEDIQPKKR